MIVKKLFFHTELGKTPVLWVFFFFFFGMDSQGIWAAPILKRTRRKLRKLPSGFLVTSRDLVAALRSNLYFLRGVLNPHILASPVDGLTGPDFTIMPSLEGTAGFAVFLTPCNPCVFAG